MTLARIGRLARSLLTLNREREFAVLKRFLSLKPSDRMLDIGSGDGFGVPALPRIAAKS